LKVTVRRAVSPGERFGVFCPLIAKSSDVGD
jgi:hypothetical protein